MEKLNINSNIPFDELINKVNEIVEFCNTKPKPILLLQLDQKMNMRDVDTILKEMGRNKEITEQYHIISVTGTYSSAKVLNPENLTEEEKERIELISNKIKNESKLSSREDI